MFLETEFKKASETGKPVIILKSLGDCDCFDKKSLLHSEPNPHCPKCLGTGKKRLKITTEKIRYDYVTQSSDVLNSVLDTTNDSFTFFMPFIYHSLTNEDLIITTDSNPKTFEVTNKFEFVHEDFSYVEIVGKKIPFVSGVAYDR